MANYRNASIGVRFKVLRRPSTSVIVCGMRDLLLLIAHLIITTIRIIAPGGARAVVAESLLLKHQLLVLNRSRKKAPRLRALDRVLLGLSAVLVSPQRVLKVAVAIRPVTLLRFPPSPGPTKISSAVFRETWEAPRPQGTVKGTDCSRSRDQTPQSALWLPAHRPANLARRRPGNRQGRGAPDSCKPPSSKVGGGKGPSWLSI